MKKRKEDHGGPGRKALKLINQYFPKVKFVVDAKSPAIIEVLKEDSQKGTIQDPGLCAFARACYRSFKADGVLVGLKTSYVVHGKRAVRYRNPESITREIVSYDRKGGFFPGVYHVAPWNPASRLGVYRGEPTHPRKNGKDRRRFMHYTMGVRVLSSSHDEIRS